MIDHKVLRYVRRQQLAGAALCVTRTFDPVTDDKLRERRLYLKINYHIKRFLTVSTPKKIVIVPGLRGVGKTTTIAQTFVNLKNKLGPRINTFYFALDEAMDSLGASLADILDAYEQILSGSYATLSKPTFIFIDEIQNDPKWPRTLKFLIDRSKNVYVICTGSSAAQIQLVGDADLEGRRAYTEKLFPMTFLEEQILKDKPLPVRGFKENIINDLYYSKDAAKVFRALDSLTPQVDRMWTKYDMNEIRSYLDRGGFPHNLNETDETVIYQSLRNMVDKIIEKDIQAIGRFRPESVPTMKRMVHVLAENDSLSLEKLGKAVNEKSRAAIDHMLDAFIASEALVKIPAYGNQLKAVKSPSRFMFMAPSIRAALFDIVGISATDETRKGLLLEDYIVLHLTKEFGSTGKGSITHPYTKKGGLADFILRIGNKRQIAIEVGFGSKTSRQAEATLSKYSCQYGLIFYEGPLKINNSKTVVMVPLNYLFLI